MGTLRLKQTSVIALLALLAACAPPLREKAPESVARATPENFPRGSYEQAAAQGKVVYRIDAAHSLIAITVRRGGRLARLGHDHVVASHVTEGYISPEEGRADLYVPLDELAVDESALRIEAGLDTQPDASAIAGTRTNMLDRVLETQKFPFAVIHVNRLENNQAGERLGVVITLHGVTRTFEVPTGMETAGDEVNVSGSIEFNQSDFGIEPFSVLGGAIRVEDHLSLRFKINARRAGR
ncbi:MAG: YceI family protein [Nitrosomonadales bacterium]|nr:YceI family protein [Nitrosomonadales bacterium]